MSTVDLESRQASTKYAMFCAAASAVILLLLLTIGSDSPEETWSIVALICALGALAAFFLFRARRFILAALASLLVLATPMGVNALAYTLEWLALR